MWQGSNRSRTRASTSTDVPQAAFRSGRVAHRRGDKPGAIDRWAFHADLAVPKLTAPPEKLHRVARIPVLAVQNRSG